VTLEFQIDGNTIHVKVNTQAFVREHVHEIGKTSVRESSENNRKMTVGEKCGWE
jgi:hypothetical protein